MLMIDHFLERETKLLEISKRGEEKYLNSNVRRILLGGYFAISHLLHALSAAIRHRERVVTSAHMTLCVCVCVQVHSFGVLSLSNFVYVNHPFGSGVQIQPQEQTV